jgi:glutamate racemase
VLASAIKAVIGRDVALVDSAETTAAAVTEALSAAGLASGAVAGSGGDVRFFATDSPERFARVGAIFLGRAIDPSSVTLVDLRAFA